jgi:hypothetical protein
MIDRARLSAVRGGVLGAAVLGCTLSRASAGPWWRAVLGRSERERGWGCACWAPRAVLGRMGERRCG